MARSVSLPRAAVLTVCLLVAVPQLHASVGSFQADSQVSDIGGSVQTRSLLETSNQHDDKHERKKCEKKCDKKFKSALAACKKKCGKDAKAFGKCHKQAEKKHKSCKKNCKKHHHHDNNGHHEEPANIGTVYWHQPLDGRSIYESSPGCWNLYPDKPVCFAVGACQLKDNDLYCTSGPLQDCGIFGNDNSFCFPDSAFDEPNFVGGSCTSTTADPSQSDCDDEGLMCRIISGRRRCRTYCGQPTCTPIVG